MHHHTSPYITMQPHIHHHVLFGLLLPRIYHVDFCAYAIGSSLFVYFMPDFKIKLRLNNNKQQKKLFEQHLNAITTL